MAALIAFLTPILSPIISGVVSKQLTEMRIELQNWMKENNIAAAKISAITVEAKSLLEELDNAQSEAERKVVLRKISNFSDLKHLL
jgi:hypothetical protein